MIAPLLQDLRYGARMLMKSRGFTVIAVLSLALGIGANTAIFSVVNAVLLRTLPFPDAERIVLPWGENQARGNHRGQVSATEVADWRARNHVFEDVTTYASFRPSLAGGTGEPERVPGAQVGDGFFSIMRAQPLLGRVFAPEEQQEGKDFVVVLSYALWQRQFGGDPGVIGKTVMLSARPYTVIGVMPADFRSLPAGLLDAPAELYRPVAEPPDEKERSSRHLRAIARLNPGVTLAEAQAEMTLIARQLEREHPQDSAGSGVRLVTLPDDLSGKIRPVLLMFFGAGVFLLLIACANVGNLLLARAVARRREVAIRAALGASSSRIVRQFLTESVLLSFTGGVLGLFAAMWAATFIETAAARLMPMLGQVEIDARVLGFTIGVSVFAGIVFGSAPALRASRANLNETLSDGGRSQGSGATRSALRSSLVVAEVALALILLVAAGLLIKTVVRLHAVDPGFKAERVLTMNIWLPQARYQKAADWNGFYERLLTRLSAQPQIEAAGLTSVLPISENFDQRTIEVEGQPHAPGEYPDVENYIVTTDYSRAMSIPLLRGRALSEQDTESSPFAVMVSEAMARKLWPGEDAIGKRVRFYNSDPVEKRPWRTVVGVLGDVKQYGLDTAGTVAMYVPARQMPTPVMTLALRTRVADPASLASFVRNEIRALDKDQAVFRVATMRQLLADSIALRRFSMFLLGLFAALALLLAAIGIYGVLANNVAQRTFEIGIRMALGAQAADVLLMIVRQGLALAFLGITTGVLGALALTRLLGSLLFGVGATDPATFAAITLLLIAISFLACYLPAQRAAKVEPLRALTRGQET